MTSKRRGISATLSEILDKRRSRQLLRSLYTCSPNQVDFSSNDYLGLAREPELVDAITKERKQYVANNTKHLGSTGSRLLSGNSGYYEQLEEYLAAFHGGQAALLFNSGYDANLGVVSSIPQKGDLVLYDALMHNSVREGLRLCRGTCIPFRHNCTGNLRELLEAPRDLPATNNIIIIVESVYSMDGHCSPLKDIVELAEEFGADVIVDEAHGTGVYGETGAGLVDQLQLAQRVFCRVHTFGKAVGAHGAVVVGSNVLKSYLINYARSLIYSTSLPAESLIAIKCAYQFMGREAKRRQTKVFELVKLFLSRKKQLETSSGTLHGQSSYLESPSPIQGIVIPGNDNVVRVGAMLASAGFDVKPIRSPTVPEGTERLRIILHYHNTLTQVDALMDAIADALAANQTSAEARPNANM